MRIAVSSILVFSLAASSGAVFVAACSTSGAGPEKMPNSGKADQAALVLSLTDERPRSLYFECQGAEGCDISLSASLRAPAFCELFADERLCSLQLPSWLQLPIAVVKVETPEGTVREATVIAAAGEDGSRTVVVGGDLLDQPPGVYFVDVRRAPELSADLELVLEASYAPADRPAPELACDLGGPPEHLAAQTSGDQRWVALRWSSGDESWLEAEGEGFEVADSSLLGRYRNTVRATGISVDPLDLLRRQRELYARSFPDHLPAFDAIISGEIGVIDRIECWEAAVMEDHLRRHLEQQVPNEFQAFLLTREVEGRVESRIYGVSGNMMSAPSSTPLMREIEEDLADGWQLAAHSHNHFFFLSHLPSGDIAGTLIPSPPDRASFVRLHDERGLLEGRITNGFDSSRFSSHEFEALVDL